MADVKKMTPEQFRDEGYLQELNRNYLHPLGLALEVEVNGDDVIFGQVWDFRDDPEGIVFADGIIDPAKTVKVARERGALMASRKHLLGYAVQPAGLHQAVRQHYRTAVVLDDVMRAHSLRGVTGPMKERVATADLVVTEGGWVLKDRYGQAPKQDMGKLELARELPDPDEDPE